MRKDQAERLVQLQRQAESQNCVEGLFLLVDINDNSTQEEIENACNNCEALLA